ncbi:hypothetical protein [Streptomyces sp. AcE210]|uniref:hypothetical protein n=1 Tax=Streptomyces sp. AcE210 TaxID=2292703 RepID=UPI000E306793|nr:hypothetical protein [Streptomyces sp. AcE210]RFC76530.1 hypothetical protein DXZ75_00195 [Streptomyces sp. AcE210]
MDIEILVVPECPNATPAAEQLQQAPNGLGLSSTTFSTRVISDQAEAERAGFMGSSTFVVNGRDPFAEPGRPAGLTCRVYRTSEGLRGLPGLLQLRAALARADPEPDHRHIP